MLGVIVYCDKGQRVDRKAEVKAKVAAVKERYICIAHLHVLDVIKYAAARARDLTEVFVPVQRLVLFTQALCLRDELVAEPRRRYVPIGGTMHNTIFAIE